jgi:transcriptional regulator with XRE-family HTH domain
MKLLDYLTSAKMTQREFAQRTGLTAATVSRICNGRQRPNLATYLKIAVHTDGRVSILDFPPSRASEQASDAA